MKVLAIVGSPRVEGNTEALARQTLDVIAEAGLETEMVRLAGLDITSCDGCQACYEGNGCIIEDDLQPIYDKMADSQGIILASYWPVAFGRAKGEVESDSEGMATARSLGRNMADLIKRLGNTQWEHHHI